MLGLIIDFQSKLESHCNKIIAKSRRVLGAIKRLSQLIYTEAATKILKSCLIGKVMYGGLFYLNKMKLRNQIEGLILEAIRIIKHTKFTDKIKNVNLMDSLKFTPIEKLLKRQTLLEVMKWQKKREKFFQPFYDRTRGSLLNKFRPIGGKHKSKTFFPAQMASLWNDYNHMLPMDDNSKCKQRIKEHIKQKSY